MHEVMSVRRHGFCHEGYNLCLKRKKNLYLNFLDFFFFFYFNTSTSIPEHHLLQKKKGFCFHSNSRSITLYKLDLFRSISECFQVEVEGMKGNVTQQEAQPRLLVLLLYIRAGWEFTPAKSIADLASSFASMKTMCIFSGISQPRQRVAQECNDFVYCQDNGLHC